MLESGLHVFLSSIHLLCSGPVTFVPLSFSYLFFRPVESLWLFICVWVCVGGCVTECDTNEHTDYSLKPRVIISSPRIKHQIMPTAGRGEAGHIDVCSSTGMVEHLQEFNRGGGLSTFVYKKDISRGINGILQTTGDQHHTGWTFPQHGLGHFTDSFVRI